MRCSRYSQPSTPKQGQRETLVILASDHGYEFDELGLGNIGHGSNYGPWQLRSTLLMRWPGREPKVYTHRSAHQDLPGTLLQEVFGCSNPASDYSSGSNLFDEQSWDWMIAGSYNSHAIVEPDKLIVSYPGGLVEVLGPDYRPQGGPQARSGADRGDPARDAAFLPMSSSDAKAVGKLRLLFYVEQDYSFDILRPLQDEAQRRGHEVRWLVFGDASASLLRPGEIAVPDAAAAVRYAPHAVFAPGDRAPSFIPGLKVEVFHGINEDKRGDPIPERGLFDLYCTQSPSQTAMLKPLEVAARLFPGPGNRLAQARHAVRFSPGANRP